MHKNSLLLGRYYMLHSSLLTGSYTFLVIALTIESIVNKIMELSLRMI